MSYKGVGKRLKWIPVSAKLPQTEVIACDKYGNVMIGSIAYHRDGYICEKEFTMLNGVVYWAKLP